MGESTHNEGYKQHQVILAKEIFCLFFAFWGTRRFCLLSRSNWNRGTFSPKPKLLCEDFLAGKRPFLEGVLHLNPFCVCMCVCVCHVLLFRSKATLYRRPPRSLRPKSPFVSIALVRYPKRENAVSNSWHDRSSVPPDPRRRTSRQGGRLRQTGRSYPGICNNHDLDSQGHYSAPNRVFIPNPNISLKFIPVIS